MKTKRVTIFEGSDGGGKTTFAKAYADRTDAHYVHCGPFTRVTNQLPRFYVEAMQPALLGLRDVVFDRAWMSEMPYGVVFRNGSRLTEVDVRMLERLAFRCGAVMVHCRPPWQSVRRSFLNRRTEEMLKDTTQLHQVYQLYDKQATALPRLTYNFHDDRVAAIEKKIEAFRPPCHMLDVRSAGNYEAPCILVGESFAEMTDDDAWYQWPFGSFNGAGCSWWLTQLLADAKISESELYWVNCDQPAYANVLPKDATVFALGDVAARSLQDAKRLHRPYPHPSAHKRFSFSEPYPLIQGIQNAIKEAHAQQHH